MWTAEPFTRGQAWVDLILLANHDRSFFYKRNVKVIVERGQVGRSEVELADRWKWSRTKLRKFINDLEKEQQVVQHKSTVTQILTISNYEEYQKKEQQSIQQQDSSKTSKEQQQDTYNNVNNANKKDIDNSDKPNNPTLPKNKIFFPPSTEEVKEYCEERKNGIDAQYFINFYQAKGWMIGKNKVKDWKACVRTWEGNNFNKSNGGNGGTPYTPPKLPERYCGECIWISKCRINSRKKTEKSSATCCPDYRA